MMTHPSAEGPQDLSLRSMGGQDEVRRSIHWAARLLWRSKHLILGCVMLALVPTILILQQTSPRYTAEVRILVEAPEVRDVMTDRPGFRLGMNELVVRSEADLISSTSLARRVVAKLRLDKDPEFNPSLREPKALDAFLSAINPMAWVMRAARTDDAKDDKLSAVTKAEMERAAVVRRFQSELKVRPERRSFVITLSYTAESREKAAEIANTVAELYLLDRLEASFDDARRVSGWLGERLEGLRATLATSEAAVEQYRAEHRLRRKGERQATVTDQQMSELGSRLVIARTELAQKQARLVQAQNLLKSHGSMETALDVLQSPLIQRLREQEANTLREISDALKTYGDRHPRIVGLRAELAEMRTKIGNEMEKVSGALANEVNVAAAGVATLTRELESARQQSDVAGEAEIRLRELERQAEVNRSLYESFLSRFKREAEQERMQRANARIVSPAEVPMAPSFPRKSATISLVFLLSLFGGVGLVFLIDRLDNAVRSSDEAEEITGVPTLAIVPQLRTKTTSPVSEILDNPRSALTDAVRSLRTAIEIGDNGSAPIVLVTSSVPKEGKTFVSLSLAMLFSQNAKRVLLIDCDVHRPRLHVALGLELGKGLADLLNGEASFADAIRPAAVGKVDFLPAGKAVNTGDLIKGPAMESLLRQLLKEYDRIVIDSPPVLAVPDTRIVARLAHRVVYLIHWNDTPRDAIRNGFKLLRGAGVTVFGAVLSRVNPRKHARYGYGDYGQYYGKYSYYRSE